MAWHYRAHGQAIPMVARRVVDGQGTALIETVRYHKGRLVVPPRLVDATPATVADWLSRVPLADRGRAFRALPLNVGAAAFLRMAPAERVGLMAALNRANIQYLVSITPDTAQVETLAVAGEDVAEAIRAVLPDWRRPRIEEQLAVVARDEKPPSLHSRLGWLGRLFRRAGGR